VTEGSVGVEMLIVVTLLCAQLATSPAGESDRSPATPTTSATSATSAATSARTVEEQELATLRRLESELSVGRALTASDRDTLTALVDSRSAIVRATAVAVLPWLEPTAAVPLLLKASRDVDARVRATAGQSLMPLGRRLSDDAERGRVVSTALLLVDDTDDEVACVGAELLSALSPGEAPAAFTTRASAASDQRYQCFARFGGLPTRAANVRALPPRPGDEPVASPDVFVGGARETSGGFLGVVVATGAGLMVGGVLPSGLVPARDFLVYDDTSTRLSRQDVSVLTTLGASVVGGAVFGGAAFALDQVAGPLSSTEATAFAAGTGSAALLGAGLAYALLPSGGAGTVLLVSTTTAGAVGSMALVRAADVSGTDTALVAGAMGLGGMVGLFGVFAALPVALTEVNGVSRRDVGLGVALATAGAAGVGALVAAPFVDVTPMRVATVVGGAAAGAGIAGSIAFAAVSDELDVATRVGAGVALGGAVLGAAAGLLVPGSWIGETTTTTTTTTMMTTTTTPTANEVE
jgi:hypothetical protein